MATTPVSASAAARGIVSYGSGGAAIYGPGGPVTAGTTRNASGAESFVNSGSATQTVGNTGMNSAGQQVLNAGGQQANNIVGAPRQITSSSAPVVQQEQQTIRDIDSLGNYSQQYDDSGLRDTYAGLQKTIKERQAQLDAEYNEQIGGINSQFNESRAQAQDAQQREYKTTNVVLQRVGGYLGTQISGVGALNNLEQTHRQEIASLEGKRAAALQAAKTAKSAEDFQLAQSLADSVKGLDQEIYKRRQDFFDESMKIVQEQRQQDQERRASQAAQISAQNQLRDDARSSLSTIISQFGGIDTRSLDKDTLSYINELAETAGIPIGSIQGPTISQQSQVNTERQREISNSIARAGLALRQKSFNLQQQISGEEAKAQGLPRSLIGVPEAQVQKDLDSTTVPEWWIEHKFPNGLPQGVTKETQTAWNNFRNEVIKTSSLVDFGDLGGFDSFDEDQPAVTE